MLSARRVLRRNQRDGDDAVGFGERESFGVARERIRKDFERHVAIELRVASPIHLSHPTFAEPRGDFIDAEAGASSHGQADSLDYTGRPGAETEFSPGTPLLIA